MSLWNNPPYYITAYGLAVKHGFRGTEEQWLKSLKGDPGKDLMVVASFDTYAEMISAYISTKPSGFVKVGSTDDYLLYYWDASDEEWYSISIIGPEGKSAYELAVEGGYPGTEEQFESDLNGFKDDKAAAVAAATAATAAKTAAETAAATATSQAAAAAGSATSAAGSASSAGDSATAAAGSAGDAAQSAAAAERAAEQAEASVGDASWILFDLEDEEDEKIGWIYVIESDTFSGADFSINNEYGSHQGWLEVSYE